MSLVETSPEVILADTPGEIRAAFLATLKEVGIETVHLVSRPSDLERLLRGTGPDLLVINAAFGDGSGLSLIRDMRMDRLGPEANPFLPVIMTSWDNGDGPVRAALSAGVDDLLVFPLPLATLRNRVQALARQRRPFIVTADYIGPERRRDPKRVSEIPYFQPPNTLGDKLSGAPVSQDGMRQTVERLRRDVSAEKLRREAFQIAFQARLIVEDHAAGTEPGLLQERLSRLSGIARGLLDRAPAPQAEALRPLVETLDRTIRDCADPERSTDLARTVRLLEPVSQGITLAVRQTGDADALAAEVERTVAAYRERARRAKGQPAS